LLVLSVTEGEGGLDEGGVAERLGVVAQMVAGERIDLLGVEPDWAGECDECLQQVGRFA
jgi:hypothetical protein